MKTADFLFPRDLEVTSTEFKKIMFVGSCLSEAYVLQFRETFPSVICDFVLFNNAADLPVRTPEEIAEYDLQYIQIPLRSVLTDAVIRIADYDKPESTIDWVDLGKQNISLMLKAAMRYNPNGNLLTFVSNFVVPQGRIAPSLRDQDSDQDLTKVIRELNSYLAQELQKYPSAFLADVDMIANSLGKRFFLDDAIGFYTHGAVFYTDWAAQERFPHWTNPSPGRIEEIQDLGVTYENKNEEFFDAVFRQVEALYRTVMQIDMVKVVIFDLDNTMWRGQLIEHYQNGATWPHSDGWPLGIWEAIHHLRRRGIVVSIASKNDRVLIEEKWNDAVQPSFVKYSDFVEPRINWLSKADNIREILTDLCLTPKGAVFVDDNPVERESVRVSLPGIRVIGSDPFVVRRILLWSPETQIAARSNETVRREEMLRKQVDREREKSTMSRTDFLKSLQSKVEVFEVTSSAHGSFSRIFELVNKTNQFNTNGNRWSLEDYRAHFGGGGHVFGFSVADRFSDYGIVGVAFVLGADVLQFVMSCRVLGMEIETAVLSRLVEAIRIEQPAVKVSGSIVNLEANTPCRDFYVRAGFRQATSNNYELDGSKTCVSEAHVEITFSPNGM
jgi:FkbH-like protein